ncbi:MAG: acetyl-CoA carboxylase biotin carboxyl carrier protein [Ignavibacteriae bacterium]|nr:acetyl-CoA carboxylase biotin carboxyl carrier protein [Ignavibacteriota bacterium]
MDLTLIKKLVKLLSESDVDEIEIEEEGKKIRVAKHPERGGTIQMAAPAQWMAEAPRFAPAPYAPAAAPVAAAPAPSAPVAAPAAASNIHQIKSPIVGTFYRSPAPDASPFVQIGSTVEPGAVLCIIEAMKLMNEIEADVTGKVVKILVENGQPVEYDQVLFEVEK